MSHRMLPRLMLAISALLLSCVEPEHSSEPSPPVTQEQPVQTAEPAPVHRPDAVAAAAETPPLQLAEVIAALGGVQAALSDTALPAPMDDEMRGRLAEVRTSPGDLPRFKLEVDGKPFDLPLKNTHVVATITGPVAEVEVRQTYHNPFKRPIESVYIFPLPENSAVNDLKMIIGDRVIESQVKKREEAKRIYEEAKSEGKTAALLEQERPNIFTQSVANIAPETDIEVIIRYVQDLTYDGAEVEFVFPMVVGPRYVSGSSLEGVQEGSGWARDTSLVGDAARISPPVVGAGTRSGADISIEVHADAAFPISDAQVATHEVAVQVDGNALELMLAEKGAIPNRDFVLRYRVAQDALGATLMTHVGDAQSEQGYFTLMLQPPAIDLEAVVGDRELIFVVDVSGSMDGMPLALAKAAASQALESMRPSDTFNVIIFASQDGVLWNEPRPANSANILEATRFIDGLTSGGGTEMGRAIDAALSTETHTGRARYVFFMTDRQVAEEEQILTKTSAYVKAFASSGNKARVFGFGVGPSPNRHLLDGLAETGNGATVYASNHEDPTRAVNTYFALIDQPVLEDVKLDWGGLEVSEVFPRVLPSVFASRPFVVHGRYDTSKLNGTITITGRANGRPTTRTLDIALDAAPHGSPTLKTLWARSAIHDAEASRWGGGSEHQAIERITQLGIDYRLVTAYTSFVAVDPLSHTDETPVTVVQAVDAPQASFSNGAVLHLNAANSSYSMNSGLLGSRDGSGRIEKASTSPGKVQALKALAKVQGNLSRGEIQEVINKNMSKLQNCYDRALLKDASLGGKLTLEWTVTLKGGVINVQVIATTLPEGQTMATCVQRVIERMRFPKPAGGEVIIRYPFVFMIRG